MKFSSYALLPAIALAAPAELVVRDSPPTGVTIEQSNYSGNGCPQGSVSSIISPDRSVITFGFDQFQAVIGPGGKPGDKQKNCQLHLGLRYPGGFQVSLVTATYHGYVRLDDGVTANFLSSYYFSQAASKTASSRTELRGAEFRNGKMYTKEDKIENASVVWSPCGANGVLNINNRIALTSNRPEASGEISNDDATVKFEQKIRLEWRRCGSNRRTVEDVALIENGALNSTLLEVV